jgi:cytochrome b subunit of formate dehydrogenase
MPDDGKFVWPYTRTPGGATPPLGTAPAVGEHEVRAFFWLSLLSTVIIAATGITVWLLLHSPTR